MSHSGMRETILLIRKRQRLASRGVTLVEVLIVLAIMAIIAGGAVALVFPQLKKARVKQTVLSAGAIKTAAEAYQQIDNAANTGCPTLKDLVAAKQLDGKKIDDPWGQPFVVHCDGQEVSVSSAGADRKEGTPDDVLDHFKDADIIRVAEL